MPAAKNPALRDKMINDFGVLWDLSGSNSTLVIQTSVPATLVTFTFANDAFGAASSGVITASFLNSGTETATGQGTATQAYISSGAGPGTYQITGMVVGDTGSGEDITLDNAAINIGQDVTISSFTVTENANFAAP